MKVKANILEQLGDVELTDELKNKLSDMELDIPNIISKETFDKKASETAELSRKLKESKSAAENMGTQKDNELAQLKAEIDTLKKDKTINNYKAQYIALGYEETMAQATAEALLNGEMETVFANQKAFNQAQKDKVVADTLNKQPDLSKGTNLSQKSAEEVEKAQMRRAFGLPE